MAFNATMGRLFIAAIVKEAQLSKLLRYGQIEHLFTANELPVYEFVYTFAKKHGKLPEEKTVLAHTAEALPNTAEPSSYYNDLMCLRFNETELKKTLQLAAKFLAPGTKDINKAFDTVVDLAYRLKRAAMGAQVMDFRQAQDLIIPDYVSKWTDTGGAGIKLGWPTLDNMTGGLVTGDVLSIVGRPGQGKALTLSTPILMASGNFKAMGDILVGDKVASTDGYPSKVEGVYPQGERPAYSVTMSDGRKVEADADHLWEVGSKRWTGTRVLTTLQIASAKHRLFLPEFKGEFGVIEPYLDPYVLGALLGDGCLCGNGINFVSMDAEIVQRFILGLPPMHGLMPVKHQNSGQATDYRVITLAPDNSRPRNIVKKMLRNLGVYGLKSKDKHIPNVAFQWKRSDRVALLNGLMDTDGTAFANQAVFQSSSKTLAEDVARLVRSLGGKVGWFTPKITTGELCHRISVILRDPADIFMLARKRQIMKSKKARLYIDTIEYVGNKDCQCISVTHPSKLFIAGDYVPTHNTWQMLHATHHAWREQEACILFASMEMKQLPIQQRLIAIESKLSTAGVKNATLTTVGLAKLKGSLTQIKTAKSAFWVTDGNLSATVDDIDLLCNILKPDLVAIDGAYLLKHPTERDRFRRAAENVELIKQRLADRCPVIASWQFAKSGSKKNKKKGEKTDLDDIGYTDAIAQISSIVLGLMQIESVETMQTRVVDILKGRNGEIGQFKTKWDFINTDFSEVIEEPVEDLQYV